MISLIPMAGAGSRFRKNNYNLPKPFIPIMGEPMFMAALKSFPIAQKYVFIVQQDFLKKYPFEKGVKEMLSEAKILSVEGVTEGQACTCLVGEEELKEEDALLISSIDYQLAYDEALFLRLSQSADVDVIVFTFKTGSITKKDPKAFAYCKEENGFVTKVVEKETISDAPHLDPAVTGSFYYKRCSDFLRGAKSMIDKNIRINGEFYVGTSINQLIEEGLKVVTMPVDKFISFGDPFELQLFQTWEDFFYTELQHPYSGWR